jgi:hypothetical protein
VQISKYKTVVVWHVGESIPYASISFAGLTGAITGMSAAGITVHEAGDDSKDVTLNGARCACVCTYVRRCPCGGVRACGGVQARARGGLFVLGQRRVQGGVVPPRCPHSVRSPRFPFFFSMRRLRFCRQTLLLLPSPRLSLLCFIVPLLVVSVSFACA